MLLRPAVVAVVSSGSCSAFTQIIRDGGFAYHAMGRGCLYSDGLFHCYAALVFSVGVWQAGFWPGVV